MAPRIKRIEHENAVPGEGLSGIPSLYVPLFSGHRGEYALAEYTEVKTVTIKLDHKNP